MTTATYVRTKVPHYVFSDEIPWERPRTTRTKFNTKCPWHHEQKGYALSVDEEKGVYYCHSCDRGGKIIDRNTAWPAPRTVPPPDRLTETGFISRTVDDYVQQPDGTWKIKPDVQVTSYTIDINPNIIRNKLNIQETVYAHRLHLPSPRADNCNQYTRLYYNEDGGKEKGVRLLCWLWGCPLCGSRLKWLWKERIKKALKGETFGIGKVIVLPAGTEIKKPMAYFRRWAKSQGVQFEYVHIRGQRNDYLFLAGAAGMFIEKEKLVEQFSSATKIMEMASWGEGLFLDQALDDVPEYEYGARRIRASKKFSVKGKVRSEQKEVEKAVTEDGGESEEEKKGHWLTVYGTIEEEAARIEDEGKQVVWFGEDYFEVIKKAEPVEKVLAPVSKTPILSFLDELLEI